MPLSPTPPSMVFNPANLQISTSVSRNATSVGQHFSTTAVSSYGGLLPPPPPSSLPVATGAFNSNYGGERPAISTIDSNNSGNAPAKTLAHSASHSALAAATALQSLNQSNLHRPLLQLDHLRPLQSIHSSPSNLPPPPPLPSTSLPYGVGGTNVPRLGVTSTTGADHHNHNHLALPYLARLPPPLPSHSGPSQSHIVNHQSQPLPSAESDNFRSKKLPLMQMSSAARPPVSWPEATSNTNNTGSLQTVQRWPPHLAGSVFAPGNVGLPLGMSNGGVPLAGLNFGTPTSLPGGIQPASSLGGNIGGNSNSNIIGSDVDNGLLIKHDQLARDGLMQPSYAAGVSAASVFDYERALNIQNSIRLANQVAAENNGHAARMPSAHSGIDSNQSQLQLQRINEELDKNSDKFNSFTYNLISTNVPGTNEPKKIIPLDSVPGLRQAIYLGEFYSKFEDIASGIMANQVIVPEFSILDYVRRDRLSRLEYETMESVHRRLGVVEYLALIELFHQRTYLTMLKDSEICGGRKSSSSDIAIMNENLNINQLQAFKSSPFQPLQVKMDPSLAPYGGGDKIRQNPSESPRSQLASGLSKWHPSGSLHTPSSTPLSTASSPHSNGPPPMASSHQIIATGANNHHQLPPPRLSLPPPPSMINRGHKLQARTSPSRLHASSPCSSSSSRPPVSKLGPTFGPTSSLNDPSMMTGSNSSSSPRQPPAAHQSSRAKPTLCGVNLSAPKAPSPSCLNKLPVSAHLSSKAPQTPRLQDCLAGRGSTIGNQASFPGRTLELANKASNPGLYGAPPGYTVKQRGDIDGRNVPIQSTVKQQQQPLDPTSRDLPQRKPGTSSTQANPTENVHRPAGAEPFAGSPGSTDTPSAINTTQFPYPSSGFSVGVPLGTQTGREPMSLDPHLAFAPAEASLSKLDDSRAFLPHPSALVALGNLSDAQLKQYMSTCQQQLPMGPGFGNHSAVFNQNTSISTKNLQSAPAISLSVGDLQQQGQQSTLATAQEVGPAAKRANFGGNKKLKQTHLPPEPCTDPNRPASGSMGVAAAGPSSATALYSSSLPPCAGTSVNISQEQAGCAQIGLSGLSNQSDAIKAQSGSDVGASCGGSLSGADRHKPAAGVSPLARAQTLSSLASSATGVAADNSLRDTTDSSVPAQSTADNPSPGELTANHNNRNHNADLSAFCNPKSIENNDHIEKSDNGAKICSSSLDALSLEAAQKIPHSAPPSAPPIEEPSKYQKLYTKKAWLKNYDLEDKSKAESTSTPASTATDTAAKTSAENSTAEVQKSDTSSNSNTESDSVEESKVAITTSKDMANGKSRKALAKVESKSNKKSESKNNKKKPTVTRTALKRLIRTGEKFLQTDPCYDIVPKGIRCMECRTVRQLNVKSDKGPPKKSAKTNWDDFCRFYQFRKLKYNKSAQITVAGFSDVDDAKENDKTLWLPSKNHVPQNLTLKAAKYILKNVKDVFGDIVKEERNAIMKFKSSKADEDTKITWKRAVNELRELCDVCSTTLFNCHYVCERCGFVVCLDCHSERAESIANDHESGTETEDANVKLETDINANKTVQESKPYKTRASKTNATTNEPAAAPPNKKSKKDSFGWLFCAKSEKHSLDRLFLTQIIAGDCLEKLWSNLQEVRSSLGSEDLDSPEPLDAKTYVEGDAFLNSSSFAKRRASFDDLSEMPKTAKIKLEESGLSAQDSKQDSQDPWPLGSESPVKDGSMFVDSSTEDDSQEDVKLSLQVTAAIEGCISSLPNGHSSDHNEIDKSCEPPVKSAKSNGFVKCKEEFSRDEIGNCASKNGDTHTFLYGEDILVLEEADNKSNMSIFQQHWRLGKPVMVRGVDKLMQISIWLPQFFAKEFGDYRSDLVDCRNGDIHRHSMKKYWDSFEPINIKKKTNKDDNSLSCQVPAPNNEECSNGPSYYSGSALWRLKDWPPGQDFLEILPKHYEDFMSNLPLKHYTTRTGKLNLACRLPQEILSPDLGPKMYSAYGTTKFPERGTTNLHLDISDAINVMVYVSGTTAYKNGSEEQRDIFDKTIDECHIRDEMKKQIRDKKMIPGALWHIFKPNDAPKIRKFLNKLADELSINPKERADPIHDQTWYLDQTLLDRLYKDYGVQSYALLQCMGDAIVIPAGAPHQVKNLHNCIKVANDFVSPENVRYCLQLTDEFRKLPETHINQEDKLQIKNILYHSVKEALRYVELSKSDEPDLSSDDTLDCFL